ARGDADGAENATGIVRLDEELERRVRPGGLDDLCGPLARAELGFGRAGAGLFGLRRERLRLGLLRTRARVELHPLLRLDLEVEARALDLGGELRDRVTDPRDGARRGGLVV